MPQVAQLNPGSSHPRTIEHIRRVMIVLGVSGVLASWVVWGWRTGIGFVLGAVIAYVNFYWLEKIVEGITKLTIERGTPASSRRIVQRFLLRYFLMALVAFVILAVSRESLYGLFAGLLLPVAAILCEAGYETYRVISG